jgi:hypothetical protein
MALPTKKVKEMSARPDVAEVLPKAATAGASWYLAMPILDVALVASVVAVTYLGDGASWIAHPPVGDDLAQLASEVAGLSWAGFGGVLAGLVFFYALTGTRDGSTRVARANRAWGRTMFWAWGTALVSVLLLALVSSFARPPVDGLGWVLLALGVLATSGAVRTTTVLLMWIRLLIADEYEQQIHQAEKDLRERLVFVDDAAEV